jgi:carboxypeptidase Taq
MSRQRDHAIATPVSLITRLAHATALAEVRWMEARQQQAVSIFAPHLEEVLHLVRDRAALLGQALGLAPYDALIDAFTPGICAAPRSRHLLKRLLAAPAGAGSRARSRRQEARPPCRIAGKLRAGQAARDDRRGDEGVRLSRSTGAGSTRATIPSPRACPATSA